MLEGDITISKCSHGVGQSEVKISLRDKLSGLMAVEATVSLQDFANALFGLAHCPCRFELEDSGRVGKTREYKQMEVLIPKHNHRNKDRFVRKAVAANEVDGWMGHDSDALNHHRRVLTLPEGAVYLISYERWV